MEQLRAIQAAAYTPWTSAQRKAYDAAAASGWTFESPNLARVIYRRGTRDYVDIVVATGEIDCGDGHLTGNGRIVYAYAPTRQFRTWAQVTSYLDRPKGTPYQPAASQPAIRRRRIRKRQGKTQP